MKNSTTHQTAETKFIEINAIKFAYRTFGNDSGVPLIFLQHFTGNIDNWDPAVTDALATERQIILFNNTGVSTTSGQTPDSVAQMAADAVSFIKALGFAKVDLLGYSLGGFIAQEIAANHPDLVSKVILAGTGPQGGTGYAEFGEFVGNAFTKQGADIYTHIFAEDTASSIGETINVLGRLYQRGDRRDPDSSMQTISAQMKAIQDWGNTDNNFSLLKKIQHPVLVVNGSNDHMFPSINSFTLFKELPLAQLSLYPDSSHGAIFQHAGLFAGQAAYFLKNGII